MGVRGRGSANGLVRNEGWGGGGGGGGGFVLWDALVGSAWIFGGSGAQSFEVIAETGYLL